MCPKITVVISEEVEKRLRDYIRSKYRRPFGKLSEVVEKSIRLYLEREMRGKNLSNRKGD